MKTFSLTDDEYKTLSQIFDDVGNDCPNVDSDKMQALGEKLGILKPIPPPTPEELKRREEFANSDFGKAISRLFANANEHIAKALLEHEADLGFVMSDRTNNYQWPENLKIGDTFRIRLPKDYVVKDENKLHINFNEKKEE